MEEPNNTLEQQDNIEGKKSNTILWVMMALLVLVIAAIFAYNYTQSSSDNSTTTTIDNITVEIVDNTTIEDNSTAIIIPLNDTGVTENNITVEIVDNLTVENITLVENSTEDNSSEKIGVYNETNETSNETS